MSPDPLKRLVRGLLVFLAAVALLVGLRQTSAAAQAGNTTDVVTSADGVRITYETRGEGTPALVFVHGWSCDRSYWSGQLEPLSREFKVVAIDLAGHGNSGLGREAWTMAAFGDDVAAVVNELGLKRAILIGHSMGGDVIMEAARRLKGRVAGLIWVDTYKQIRAPRPLEEVKAFVDPFRANFVERTRSFVKGMFPREANPALVARVAADMSSAPPDVAVGALESAFRYDREVPRVLQELKLPVIAINPDYRPTDIESMKNNGVEVILMTGVGHFLFMEGPERFNGLLKAAIDKIGR